MLLLSDELQSKMKFRKTGQWQDAQPHNSNGEILGRVIHSQHPAPPPVDHPTFSFISSILYTHHSSVFPVSTFLRSLHILLNKITFCCLANLRDWMPGVNLLSGSTLSELLPSYPPDHGPAVDSFFSENSIFFLLNIRLLWSQDKSGRPKNSSLQHRSLKSVLYNYILSSYSDAQHVLKPVR